MRLGLGF